MNTPKVGRSKRAISLKEDIQFHSDGCGREGHPAINVKYYGRWPNVPNSLTEQEQEAIWESVCEQFWEEAIGLAHKHGYSCVFSEGRSGGWLVPFYQYQAGEQLAKFHNWPGQGGAAGTPNEGYPCYPDVGDRADDRRFRAFRFDIEQLLVGVPDMLRAELTFAQEQAEEVDAH